MRFPTELLHKPSAVVNSIIPGWRTHTVGGFMMFINKQVTSLFASCYHCGRWPRRNMCKADRQPCLHVGLLYLVRMCIASIHVCMSLLSFMFGRSVQSVNAKLGVVNLKHMPP